MKTTKVSTSQKKQEFKCKACGDSFRDGWSHVLKEVEGGWLGVKDEAHVDYYKKVEKSNYQEPCFCGGTISTYGSGPDSYEVICLDCNFLWAEG